MSKKTEFPPLTPGAPVASVDQIRGVLGGRSRGTVWRLFASGELEKVLITPGCAGTPIASLKRYAESRGFPLDPNL